MTTYKCGKLRPLKSSEEIRNVADAAMVFANRLAQQTYGKAGFCHHVRRDSTSALFDFANFEAFIGYRVRGVETVSGKTISMSVSWY